MSDALTSFLDEPNSSFEEAINKRQEAATMANELKPFGTVTSAWNTRPAAPVEGLETCVSLHVTSTDTYPDIDVEVHDGSYIQPSDRPILMVTKAQAEAIIAAKDVEILQLLKELRTYIKRAEKAEADNAALTARVKELEEKKEMLVWAGEQSIGEIEALETQLAAAEGVLSSIAHTFTENSHGSMKSLSGSFYQSMANRYFAEKAKP